jgi:hypothetical protein
VACERSLLKNERRKKKVRRLLMALIGIIVALALTSSSLALAQEKGKPEKAVEAVKATEKAKTIEGPKTEAAKPGMARPEATKKEVVSRALEYRMGGLVTAVDAAAGKITIDQHQVKRDRKVTLKVGKKSAKELADTKVGDAINVWVAGNKVTNLTKIF